MNLSINWSAGQPDDYFGGEDCVETWQQFGNIQF